MFIEQTIEFELRGPGPPGRICNPKTSCFCDKTKFSKANFQAHNNLLLKNIAEGYVLCFPFTWTEPIKKFIQKNTNFIRESLAKRRLNNLIFSIGFQFLKI